MRACAIRVVCGWVGVLGGSTSHPLLPEQTFWNTTLALQPLLPEHTSWNTTLVLQPLLPEQTFWNATLVL